MKNNAVSAVILINHSCSDYSVTMTPWLQLTGCGDSMASCIGVNDRMISQQVVFGSDYTHLGI